MEKRSEIITTKTREVSCDGGHDYGHPMVYLHIGKEEKVICPYCSREFILADTAHIEGHA